MPQHSHGDPRRPDGDLVSGVEPRDERTDPEPREFGPKVGWGHDAVYRPDTPSDGDEPEITGPDTSGFSIFDTKESESDANAGTTPR